MSWMNGFNVLQGQKCFPLPPCREWLWNPPSLLWNTHQGYFLQVQQLECESNQSSPSMAVPMLRMCEAMVPLPHTPSRHGLQLKTWATLLFFFSVIAKFPVSYSLTALCLPSLPVSELLVVTSRKPACQPLSLKLDSSSKCLNHEELSF
jgi:hypothetical protein